MTFTAHSPDEQALAVQVAGLRVVRGGREVLHDLSFGIRRGSVTGLIGPSGCGKTTLMRAIGVPSVLMILLRYVINNPLVFDRFGPMQQVTVYPAITGTLRRDLAIIAGCTLLALGLGAATLRRRTP